MRRFEFDVVPPSATNGEYPGAFPPQVDTIIRRLVNGNTLHLFSGSSLIGQERIDISHPNATKAVDVKEFIKADDRSWEWVVLDPPYAIQNEGKLRGYGITTPVTANVSLRRLLKYYLQRHADNILWLDFCAPMITGFRREKLWLVLTGGFHTVRVLSWLKREMKPLL